MALAPNIIEELARFVPERDKHLILEARSNNIITSASTEFLHCAGLGCEFICRQKN